MALTKVGESFNMPVKVYYCETQKEFDDNFANNDLTTPGSQVFILEENLIKVKGDTYWGDFSVGSISSSITTPSGESVPYAYLQEGF